MKTPILATSLSLLWCGSAIGQVSVVSNDAAWPADAVVDTGAPGTAMVTQVGVPHTLDYDGERDVKNQRPLLQTFNLPADVSELVVEDIYIYYWGGNTSSGGAVDSFDILIFEIDDVFAAGGVSGDDDITSNPPVNAGNGGLPIFSGSVTVGPASIDLADTKTRHVLHLSIIGGPTLTKRPGNAGYGFMLYNPDTDGTYPFKWAAERIPYEFPVTIDLGPYLLGRPYSDSSGSFQESHDLSLAVDGTATPAESWALLRADGPTTLGVATGHFDTHTIEGSPTLNPTSWTVVDTVEGDGTVKSVEVTPPSSPYFYRVND